jgi:SAM-dependent methyltransferase
LVIKYVWRGYKGHERGEFSVEFRKVAAYLKFKPIFTAMYEFHGDKRRYFDMTHKVTVGHIIPFLQSNWSFPADMRVLEIGCGEAGVLKAFTDLGFQCTGIELEESRLEFAREFMQAELAEGKVQFLNNDIYDVVPESDLGTRFDLIILKDVIEHIPDQARFMPQLHRFLKPGGRVFFAFPPWQMPYGGHQQVLPQKWASKMPYYHLLPGGLYPAALKALGVQSNGIKTMEEIRSTGISIERFLRICSKSDFNIAGKKFYLFNPIYEYKFGIKPRIQLGVVGAIPFLRNFVTMGVYYLTESRN